MHKRFINYITLIFCAVLICPICINTVYAASSLDKTVQLTESDKEQILKKIGLEMVREDGNQAGIKGFDVTSDGTYALAFGTGANCRISVYDSDGLFLYGFKFSAEGDYGIAFCGDDLAIYLLRGKNIVVYDSAGRCTQATRSIDTDTKHFISLYSRTEKRIAGKQYKLERDLAVGDSYSRLVAVDESGERVVLYDFTAGHIGGQSVLVVIIVMFFAVVIWGVSKKGARGTSTGDGLREP